MTNLAANLQDKKSRSEWSSEYYKKNRSRIRAVQQEWRRLNPNYNSAWRTENPQAIRDHSTQRQRRLRQAILDVLGRQCVRCSFADERALQVDHVRGSGNLDINGAGMAYYSRLVKFLRANPTQTKYQLLCANCNWIKRSENNENARRRP